MTKCVDTREEIIDVDSIKIRYKMFGLLKRTQGYYLSCCCFFSNSIMMIEIKIAYRNA